MSNRAKTALAAGLGVVALTATYLTVPWEGMENHAYWDRLGKVWTVCAGETSGVKKGDSYTNAECMDMLYERMERDFHQPLRACIDGFDAAPLSVQASFLDLAWNIGTGAVCRSTAAKRAEHKDWSGACEAMTWFNRAGGQVVRGLDLRRKDGDASRIGERELCLEGIE